VSGATPIEKELPSNFFFKLAGLPDFPWPNGLASGTLQPQVAQYLAENGWMLALATTGTISRGAPPLTSVFEVPERRPGKFFMCAERTHRLC